MLYCSGAVPPVALMVMLPVFPALHNTSTLGVDMIATTVGCAMVTVVTA